MVGTTRLRRAKGKQQTNNPFIVKVGAKFVNKNHKNEYKK
jgi:hypothetical protein